MNNNQVSLPDINGVTVTVAEVEKLFRPYTEHRKMQISNSISVIKPSFNGTAYYFSNNGSAQNDGLSPEMPFDDLEKLKELPLKAGDVVYLERGSIFRKSIISTVDGVSYTAYGEGAKPRIYTYSEMASGNGKWLATDKENVYKFYQAIPVQNLRGDVGTIVFDDGVKWGIKALANDDGINITTTKSFKDYHDLDEDYHFWHDIAGEGELYLYLSKGNPSEVHKEIEISLGRHAITVRAHNITIDNIHIKYCASHGIGVPNFECCGLTVTNCEFDWIGGAIQFGIVRYGNGVEVWGGCKNFRIDNCRFNQIYDAAVTFQFESKSDINGIFMQNINFTNNVMENCNYSIEYFLHKSDTELNYIKDVNFENNIAWYAGYGLCSQRRVKNHNSHIKSWAHGNNTIGKFMIKNNAFILAENELAETYTAYENIKAEYSSNIYVQFINSDLGITGNSYDKVKFNEDNVKNYFGDKTAKTIYVEG